VVAHLVRLRLRLLGNTLRKSVWQMIGMILGCLYALYMVGMITVGAIAGGAAAPELTPLIIVAGGAVIVLAWWIIPILASGVDATLDPHRFVLFGIPRRTLMTGLSVAGLTTIPGATTVLAVVGLSLAWWRTPAIIPLALIGGLLAVAICVVGSRAWTTALMPLLDSRRSREVLTIVAFVPLMLFGPLIGTVSGSLAESEPTLETVQGMFEPIASVLAWTPLGAPWAIPVAAADGAWLLLVARLAVAVATLAVTWLVWDRSLAKALVTPRHPGAQTGKSKGIDWFDRFAATPTGAVAARCLTYWMRDPRYSAGIAVIPLLPVVLIFVGDGLSSLLLILPPMVAWILGFAVSADIAYDHTAFALHVATGVSGRADRTGRVMAVGSFGGVVLAVFLFGSLALTGRWDLTAMMIGATVGVFGVSLGVSSVTSVRLIYPVVKPGDNPMRQPQGSAMAQLTSQGLGMLLMFVLSLPVLVPALLAVVLSPVFGWVTLVLGLVWGPVALVAGIRLGARWYDRRGPEMLQQVVAQA